jgi:hypothetical protein
MENKQVFFVVVLAVILARCAGAEMAGGSGAAGKSKKPIVPPTGLPAFGCIEASVAANAGQTVQINVAGYTASTSVAVQDDFGTAKVDTIAISYTAPGIVSENRDVVLTLKDGSKTASCLVKLIGTGKVLIHDDGTSRALLANIYKLNHGPGVVVDREVYNLPDLSTLTPLPQRYMAPNINVPTTKWTNGFPSAPDLVEWFAIRFSGKISAPLDGQYTFKFSALDDGAKLFIDDQLVLNWDGLSWPEAIAARQPSSINLTKGEHSFRVDYLQGPRDYLGVVLQWKVPNTAEFSVIPASALSRP